MRLGFMKITSVTVLSCLVMLCFPLELTADEYHAKRFESCMQDIGAGIFSGAFPDSKNCYMNLHDEDMAVFKDSIFKYIRKRIKGKNADALAACRKRWDTQWQDIYSEENKASFVKYKSKLLTISPSSGLSSRQYALYRRAEFEREMTLFAMENGWLNAKPDEYDCFIHWLPIVVARAENIAFLKSQKFISQLNNGILAENIHPQFWLIIQHADLHKPFQKEVLILLENHQQTLRFSEILLNSLRERVRN